MQNKRPHKKISWEPSLPRNQRKRLKINKNLSREKFSFAIPVSIIYSNGNQIKLFVHIYVFFTSQAIKFLLADIHLITLAYVMPSHSMHRFIYSYRLLHINWKRNYIMFVFYFHVFFFSSASLCVYFIVCNNVYVWKCKLYAKPMSQYHYLYVAYRLSNRDFSAKYVKKCARRKHKWNEMKCFFFNMEFIANLHLNIILFQSNYLQNEKQKE